MAKNRGIGFGSKICRVSCAARAAISSMTPGGVISTARVARPRFASGMRTARSMRRSRHSWTKVACGYRYLFTSDALEQLTQMILSLSGPQFGHVVYTSSGSESMESALKVALQYFDARGLPAKRRFISRHRSYHGNTLGALSISGYAERRAPFEGSLLDVSFVSTANAYRPPASVEEADLAQHLANELEFKIQGLRARQSRGFHFRAGRRCGRRRRSAPPNAPAIQEGLQSSRCPAHCG